MTTGKAMDRVHLQWEIEQFLFEEAALVEERRYKEWLELMADDILYTMPAREIRSFQDADKQFLPINKGAHIADNKILLGVRVQKLYDPKAWAENPASWPRLALTNIRVKSGEAPDEYKVTSNFSYTRTRLNNVYPTIVGRREDVLRRADNPFGFQVARRVIYLDHASMPGTGLTTFI